MNKKDDRKEDEEEDEIEKAGDRVVNGMVVLVLGLALWAIKKNCFSKK